MTELSLRLAQALSADYAIERELGGGGMSRVFLARDRILGRLVVIKVLPPEFAEALSPERFTREVRVAAQLQHPHLVPLLTAGQADGLLYYTMPYIEGESLRARLSREGALPVAEAGRILREVADALSAAHARDVIHRDIKPDNILLSQGHALITDFGIAKAMTEAGSATSATATGLVVGTPAYMAPEQASADPHVDHRADLYALGVVAYEMLAGQPPFSGATAQAVIAAHVTRTPAPLEEMRPSVTAPLANLVMALLAKQPADRPQSALQVVTALDAVLSGAGTVTGVPTAPRAWPLSQVLGLFALTTLMVIGIAWALDRLVGLPEWFVPAAALLMGIGCPIVLTTALLHNRRLAAPGTYSAVHHRVFTWRRALTGGTVALGGLGLVTLLYMGMRAAGVGPFGSLIASGKLSAREPILVADFDNRTRDSLLGDAVTEAFKVHMAQSRVVSLLPASYVAQILRLMGRQPGGRVNAELAREIATRGGIKAIVEGEIHSAGGNLLLTARLVETATGTELSAVQAEARDSSGILPAVEKISAQLRERIGESLREVRSNPPLEQVTTASLEALRKYSQATRAADGGDGETALRLLEETVAIDSGFAMAWRKLGIILGNSLTRRDREVEALTRAYRLRDHLTTREHYLTISSYHMGVTSNRDSALAGLLSLLDEYPDDAYALNNVGVIHEQNGEHAAGYGYYRRAVAHAPLMALSWGNVVTSAIAAGWEDSAKSALAEYRKVLPNAPDIPVMEVATALAFRHYAVGEPLIRAQLAAASISPRQRARWLRMLGGVLIIQGRFREADAALKQEESAWLQSDTPDNAVVPRALRANFLSRDLGRLDQARSELAALERQYPQAVATAIGPRSVALVEAAVSAGDLDRAHRYLANAERTLSAAPGGFAFPLALARAALVGGGADKAQALEALRMSRAASICWPCIQGMAAPGLDQMGQRDSALVYYQGFLDAPEPGWDIPVFPTAQASAYRRLGELYEWKGNRERALESYRKFVELWKDADPAVQPRVAEARRRIEELSREGR